MDCQFADDEKYPLRTLTPSAPKYLSRVLFPWKIRCHFSSFYLHTIFVTPYDMPNWCHRCTESAMLASFVKWWVSTLRYRKGSKNLMTCSDNDKSDTNAARNKKDADRRSLFGSLVTGLYALKWSDTCTSSSRALALASFCCRVPLFVELVNSLFGSARRADAQSFAVYFSAGAYGAHAKSSRKQSVTLLLSRQSVLNWSGPIERTEEMQRVRRKGAHRRAISWTWRSLATDSVATTKDSQEDLVRNRESQSLREKELGWMKRGIWSPHIYGQRRLRKLI